MFGLIKNQSGETLDYTFHEGLADSLDLFIIGHGVTGNKDRPFVVALAEAVANAGIHTLRFSFAGNGSSEGEFRDCTISKEVEDLQAVLTTAVENGYRVTYAGHSMGGAVGVLATAEDSRIQFLISLAGMVNTEKFYETEFGEEIPDKGCMWEETDYPLSSKFADDLRAIQSTAPQAAQISVPWLLVHGTTDDVVLIDDSREAYSLATEPKKLVEIDGANHVFSESGLQPMIEAVISWLKDSLKR